MEVHKTTARIAADVVETLARFYAIEARIRGSSAKLFAERRRSRSWTNYKGMEISAPLLPAPKHRATQYSI
ncbi:hypothetical protein HNQ95_003348 [Aminobacter ciceronei]|uniref:Uncharacterized protein n=1 Tax=Aminobacter ciceronei TaxID=150723 RepID=A0ABR6C8L8_9HYPH|nr:hypothetical protein [Aminobacter ciceronei]MBA8907564.1 hypothetical protein [Aminobacter ciceronei]MBA9021335.1 hypothetical protein [Aminobacter ciceronei]